MAGEVAAQAGQSGGVDALGLQLVEQPAQFARQGCRLAGRGRARGPKLAVGLGGTPGEDQARQQHLPAEAGQRLRAFQPAVRPGLVDRRQQQFVGVDVAQRRHARQQQGPAVAQAQEGFAQRPPGTTGRQQHRHPRQAQRVAPGLGQQPFGQGIDERNAGRDRMDVRPVGHGGQPA
ncbi:hypothetical protein STHU_00570 [Allostella humosa]|nr:hypothetical protein STHU_00570 [Stella humosa]